MIPVRVHRSSAPGLTLGPPRDLRPDHPLYGSECPACGDQLTGDRTTLVYVGREPDGQVEGWATGGAVAVHEDCAVPGSQPEEA
jgi:hypothetical protein